MKKLLIFAIALTSMLATSCDEITDSLEDLQDQVEDQLGGGGSTEISGLVKSITTNDGDYSAVITYFYNDDNQVTSLEYAMTYPAELAPGKSEATAAPSRSRTLEMFERQLPSFFTPRSARLTEVASRAASATSEGMQEIYTVTYEYDDDKITVTVSGTVDGEEIEDEVAYFDLNSDGYVSETSYSGSYEYDGVVYNTYDIETYSYTSDGYLTSISSEYGDDDYSSTSTHVFEWSNGNIASASYTSDDDSWHEVETYTYGSDLNNTNLDITMLYIWGDDYFMGNTRDIYGKSATNLVTRVDEVWYYNDEIDETEYSEMEYGFDGDKLTSITSTTYYNSMEYNDTIEISYY